MRGNPTGRNIRIDGIAMVPGPLGPFRASIDHRYVKMTMKEGRI
jgi:hypothetical protein